MTGARFLCFISGLGIGIAAACLSAPRSGEETRRTLRNSASKGQDLVRRQADEVKKTIVDTVQRGKLAAKTTTEGVKKAVEEGKAVLLS